LTNQIGCFFLSIGGFPRHKTVDVDNVLGNFEERLIGYSEEEAKAAQKDWGEYLYSYLHFLTQ
jgi:hypothetical protein